MLKKLSIAIMISCLLFLAIINFAYGEEQELRLIYKSTALQRISEDRPILGENITILDTDNDGLREIIVSGNGYFQIYKWRITTLEKMWKSPQFKYDFHIKGNLTPLTMYELSKVIPVNYRSNNKLNTTILFFAYTGPKSSDIYELTWYNNQYKLHKRSQSPFSRFSTLGTCSDGSTALVGELWNQSANYNFAAYKWSGSALLEKWRDDIGGGGQLIVGTLFKTPYASEDIFFVINHRSGMLTCDDETFKLLPIDKTLWGDKSISGNAAIFGSTRNNSKGELWLIEYPVNEYAFYAKLHVSQFDGKKFAPFSRVYFKGIDSDMIHDMIIADMDGDGIGEILGVEEKIRKRLPRKHPGDEMGPVLITSNMFLAKWNGKEYDVKWHRKAVNERVRKISVEDVTGDGKKEIIAADENGYVYVFEMPSGQ